MNPLSLDLFIELFVDNRHSIERIFLLTIDYLGAFAFAVSGIRLASAKRFDFLGAFIVGFVTAMGGGTLRDMILGIPVFWTTAPSYFITTLAALLFTIIFRKNLVKMNYTLFLFDTIGLGLFTVVGITVALDAGQTMFIAIILGAITGSAGGVLRDILINEVPLLFRKDIYVVTCISGGVVYYLCTLVEIEQVLTQLLTMAVVILLRLFARYTNISLPPITTPEIQEEMKTKL